MSRSAFDYFQPRLPINHPFVNAPVHATPLQNPVNVFVNPLTGGTLTNNTPAPSALAAHVGATPAVHPHTPAPHTPTPTPAPQTPSPAPHTPAQPVFPPSPSKSKNRYTPLAEPDTFKEEINRVSRMIGLSYDDTLELY